ncbi:MAG: DUF4876 domain-containing protein [Calditrichaceae bacterium]|nr:DUF4876 domain-containing protein [Calditrichaceae bacterium]
MKKLYSLFLLVFMIFCTEKTPTNIDGNFNYQVKIVDLSGILNSDTVTVPNALVTLESRSYFDDLNQPQKYTDYSGSDGVVYFNGLPAAAYTLTAEKDTFYLDLNSGNKINIKLIGSGEVELLDKDIQNDILAVDLLSTSSIVINEIYFCGPVNTVNYVYDQYVELYNSGDTTAYLDGLIICRARPSVNPDMETNDFLQASYFFKFPGECNTTRDYPIEPGQFIVVASDAFDHSSVVATSVDLSGADWEFFNPYAGDIDYPADNVSNIDPELTIDFLIGLVQNAVILADGSNSYYGEVRNDQGDQYIHIPIDDVFDVVEYSINPETEKRITIRLDAGYAGVGIQKYSGKSVERRFPGFDINNSSLDFINLDEPTPGFQHQ